MSNLVYCPMTDGLKHCSACKQFLARTKFNGDSTKTSGLSSRCAECSRLTSAVWYRDNRDRALAEAAARHAANPAVNKAAVARYLALHPERRKAASARYYAKNKERVKAAAWAWAKANPEEARARSRAYNKAHPAERQAASLARRARKTRTHVGPRKPYLAFVAWARAAKSIPCYWCQSKTKAGRRHLDHIIPLIKGGSDSVANLCVACAPCNQRKSSTLPEDFALSGQSEISFQWVDWNDGDTPFHAGTEWLSRGSNRR